MEQDDAVAGKTRFRGFVAGGRGRAENCSQQHDAGQTGGRLCRMGNEAIRIL
jgi:hypothetical protein